MATQIVKTACRGTLLLAAALILLSIPLQPAAGQRNRIVIKMASMAPPTSPWHDALMIMSQRWREASDGRVVLQIIPSAQGGEEAEVLRKMRFGQFQAGTFSLAGLQHLTPACVVLAIPLLAENQEDLHRIREAVGPELEEVFLEEGFVVLHWADLGWMRFFTPNPDPSPEAVRSYKYVQWGDDSMTHLWREAGFPPGVRLPIADITVGLETGLVEAINTAPLVVAGYQWFDSLPYMIDIPWAPLSGATLVDRRTWERIPEGLRPVLREIAQEIGEELRESLSTWELDVIQAMTEQAGLQVITPTPELMAEWRRLFEEAREPLRGEVIPEAWFDEAVRVAQEGKGR
jgi:TRAP-type C4-dicarboxylate transport system substrate-binding protein